MRYGGVARCAKSTASLAVTDCSKAAIDDVRLGSLCRYLHNDPYADFPTMRRNGRVLGDFRPRRPCEVRIVCGSGDICGFKLPQVDEIATRSSSTQNCGHNACPPRARADHGLVFLASACSLDIRTMQSSAACRQPRTLVFTWESTSGEPMLRIITRSA
jgi:hypothetical protein